ncbi:MAG: molybdate ABC transporter substrate-binding protein, partial [Steroidobacter sp.]
MKKIGTLSRIAYSLIMAVLLSPIVHAADASPALTVYAAASLTNALDEIGNSYTKETGQTIKFSYGASSTLARQIEAGASADVFFSADNDWMDYLQERNLINKATRKSLLGNTLVLIAPADSSIQLKIVPSFALSATLGK